MFGNLATQCATSPSSFPSLLSMCYPPRLVLSRFPPHRPIFPSLEPSRPTQPGGFLFGTCVVMHIELYRYHMRCPRRCTFFFFFYLDPRSFASTGRFSHRCPLICFNRSDWCAFSTIRTAIAARVLTPLIIYRTCSIPLRRVTHYHLNRPNHPLHSVKLSCPTTTALGFPPCGPRIQERSPYAVYNHRWYFELQDETGGPVRTFRSSLVRIEL